MTLATYEKLEPVVIWLGLAAVVMGVVAMGVLS